MQSTPTCRITACMTAGGEVVVQFETVLLYAQKKLIVQKVVAPHKFHCETQENIYAHTNVSLSELKTKLYLPMLSQKGLDNPSGFLNGHTYFNSLLDDFLSASLPR